MLDLQPLIARFVDDVFRALRGASLDELRSLLRAGEASEPARSARPPRKAHGERVNGATTAQATARPRGRAAARPRAVAAQVESPEPPAVAEITDPEALLAAAFATPLVSVSVEAPAAPRETEPPASGERANGSARLRDGESFARSAGAGVVIRRAKRG